MKIEWDEFKRQTNLRKHGIDFNDLLALFDGYTVTVVDSRFAYDEERFLTVGLVKGDALVVAHTERGEKIRVISARRATKNEEIAYWEEITNQLGATRRSRKRKY